MKKIILEHSIRIISEWNEDWFHSDDKRLLEYLKDLKKKSKEDLFQMIFEDMADGDFDMSNYTYEVKLANEHGVKLVKKG